MSDRNEYLRRWRATNRERMRDYFRKYREAHPELRTYYSNYYRQHREKWAERSRRPETKARRKQYNATHRELLNNLRREWDKKNPERARAITLRHQENRKPLKRITDRQYRREHPEIYKASVKNAKAKKPELYRVIQTNSSLRRRARKMAAEVEPVSITRVVARDRNLCHLCMARVERPDRSLDHIIPVARGGAHAEWNLALAHITCNKKRHTRQLVFPETKDAAMAYIAAKNAEAGAL